MTQFVRQLSGCGLQCSECGKWHASLHFMYRTGRGAYRLLCFICEGGKAQLAPLPKEAR